jgi:NADPH-dependent 2,4-dienoyl-CoA reductase/sulfur reductase-like enzyme
MAHPGMALAAPSAQGMGPEIQSEVSPPKSMVSVAAPQGAPENLVIVGSGPAGYTAAIDAALGQPLPLLITGVPGRWQLPVVS